MQSKKRRMRFAGPLLPGPDWVEPMEKFDPDHLRRFCSASPRVQSYLARLEAKEHLIDDATNLQPAIQTDISLAALAEKYKVLAREVERLQRTKRPAGQKPIMVQNEKRGTGFKLGDMIKGGDSETT